MLFNLTNNFEQVILITHIDDIKDGIENIIKIEFDEEKGCSRITQQKNVVFENTEINDIEDFSVTL